MTHDEANVQLNAFAGWKVGQKCERVDDTTTRGIPYCALHDLTAPHDIPPTDYFADTPEAREAVRVLKDEFVRRTGRGVDVHSRGIKGKEPLFGCWAGVTAESGGHYGCAPIESHAIAFAIAAALQEQRAVPR